MPCAKLYTHFCRSYVGQTYIVTKSNTFCTVVGHLLLSCRHTAVLAAFLHLPAVRRARLTLRRYEVQGKAWPQTGVPNLNLYTVRMGGRLAAYHTHHVTLRPGSDSTNRRLRVQLFVAFCRASGRRDVPSSCTAPSSCRPPRNVPISQCEWHDLLRSSEDVPVQNAAASNGSELDPLQSKRPSAEADRISFAFCRHCKTCCVQFGSLSDWTRSTPEFEFDVAVRADASVLPGRGCQDMLVCVFSLPQHVSVAHGRGRGTPRDSHRAGRML